MTPEEFRQSFAATEPPAGLTHALAGLWWDAKGDWKRAHESAQQDEGAEGAWVHAYLHGKSDDLSDLSIYPVTECGGGGSEGGPPPPPQQSFTISISPVGGRYAKRRPAE